jgi:hypothetical protein
MVKVIEVEDVRIEWTTEIATSLENARICVYKNNTLIANLDAIIHYEKGADGKYYPVVVFLDKTLVTE